MPVALREVRAFEGPNIYYPQPAVKLVAWADRDIARPISDTLKQWAQVTGLVIGYLRQHTDPAPGGVLITTTWTTPLPTVGAQIAEQVVADIDAADRRDEEYDHDDALMAIIRERKRQEPGIALLQILAEAHAHDVPVLRRADGQLVVGSGARGWSFDPALLALGLHVDVPWDSVGTVPVVAITGPGAHAVAAAVAALLTRSDQRVGQATRDGITIAGEHITAEPSADWNGARRVLTDGRVDVAVLETTAHSILERGVGFDQCRVGVVTGVDDAEPDVVAAHGVVVLATDPDGVVVLNGTDAQVSTLQAWAPGAVLRYGTPNAAAGTEPPDVYRDGDAVYVDGSTYPIAALPPQITAEPAPMLAVIAVVHALGIDIAS